ncbi:MAG: hypothetical protein KAS71_01270 [Bacteroidales bacterium]|nr:hypothetical protein [Bacteroidales bacterium]
MKQIINITLTLTILIAGMNVYAEGDKTTKAKKATAEKVLTKIENAFDTELSLETWMTEIKEFYVKEIFSEEELKLESWMTKSFNVEEIDSTETEPVMEDSITECLITEDKFIEEELQFEDWMFDLKK